MTRLTVIFLLVLLLLLAAMLGALIYFFRFAHLRRSQIPSNLEREGDAWAGYQNMMDESYLWLEQQPTEEFSVTSFDGLQLHGTYIPAENARACVILFHGYRSTGLRDFAPLLPFYAAHGLSSLVVDQRACGKSSGKLITFGIKERRDALTWAEYAHRRFAGETPILLHGISMGAATVMMAADLPLPESVVGLIGDCGYTSPYAIIAHCAKKWFHIPAFPLVDLLSLFAKAVAGFGYRDCCTLDTLARSSKPIFLIHGGEDDFVPTYMSEENAKAARNCKGKLIVPGAGHGMSYMTAMEQCRQTLLTYVKEILEENGHGTQEIKDSVSG